VTSQVTSGLAGSSPAYTVGLDLVQKRDKKTS
jgi:hypothetical protein